MTGDASDRERFAALAHDAQGRLLYAFGSLLRALASCFQQLAGNAGLGGLIRCGDSYAS